MGPSIIEMGATYLSENSALAKTYKGIKEIRELFKITTSFGMLLFCSKK
ncbi:YjcQ family protein [Lysinibacillus sphaericus]